VRAETESLAVLERASRRAPKVDLVQSEIRRPDRAASRACQAPATQRDLAMTDIASLRDTGRTSQACGC